MPEQFVFDSKKASERFITVRTNAGLTQEELASKLGVALQTIKNYEKAGSANVKENSSNDRSNAIAGMKIETLFKMAKQFGVSSDYLLGNSTIMSPVMDVQSIVKASGLSERSAQALFIANRITMPENWKPEHIREFRTFFNIPYYTPDDSLFSVCLAIPDFIDTVLASLISDDTFLAQITTAFNMWFSSKPEVNFSENVLPNNNPFINNDRIAIQRSDFVKLCSYQIASTVADALSTHYTDNSISETV